MFNGSLHKEILDVRCFSDVAEMLRRHARTSTGIITCARDALGGLLVPSRGYCGRVDKVLPQSRPVPGRATCLSCATSTRERCLEPIPRDQPQGGPEPCLAGVVDDAAELDSAPPPSPTSSAFVGVSPAGRGSVDTTLTRRSVKA